MRDVTDGHGQRWDATIGKESWGTLVVLFSPRGEGAPKKAVLAAETPFDAERELESMTDDALRDLLSEAQPWT